jgi:YD repeat-containing protein
MQKMIILALWFTVVGYLLSGSAKAQITDSCSVQASIAHSVSNASCLRTWGFDELPDPNAPPTMVCCNPGGIPFNQTCIAPRPSCGAPANAANETCPGCAKLAAGRPINLATGNTYIMESDISVPGLGGGLALARTWNSILPAIQNSYPFMFGTNWRSNLEERLVFVSGDGYVKYMRGDGSVWSFAFFDEGPPNVFKAAAPATDTTTTITAGSPSWTVAFKSGEKRLFNSTTGLLTSIIDRNGNTTVLSYDASNRLMGVVDPSQRHLIFNYPGGTASLVSSVTTDMGISLSYVYDTQGRLSQVTKPDSTTITFQYDVNSNIISVVDTTGILESHSYDALHRGLTSSRADGIENVIVTYPQ